MQLCTLLAPRDPTLTQRTGSERVATVAEQTPVAKFRPGFRTIKLYPDGRVEYQGSSGSVVGATARVDSSGSKRLFRDTREVFLMIEGPRVSIVASLGDKGHLKQKQARQFAAKVNQLAMQLGDV